MGSLEMCKDSGNVLKILDFTISSCVQIPNRVDSSLVCISLDRDKQRGVSASEIDVKRHVRAHSCRRDMRTHSCKLSQEKPRRKRQNTIFSG